MANSTEPPKAALGKIAVPGSRRGVKGFFAETMREMRKVSWPEPQETTRLTGIVLVVCALIAVALLVSQYVLGNVVDFIEQGRL